MPEVKYGVVREFMQETSIEWFDTFAKAWSHVMMDYDPDSDTNVYIVQFIRQVSQ